VATTYATDDLGNAVSETSPDRGSWSYVHDAAGNLTSRVRPTGGAAKRSPSSRAVKRPRSGPELLRSSAQPSEDHRTPVW